MTQLDIIERISIIRTRANLSARALSIRIGKNPAYINHLETGKHIEPSLSTLMDICEVCNVSMEEFFYENFEQYLLDKQTLAFLKTLSPAQKNAIMNLYNK